MPTCKRFVRENAVVLRLPNPSRDVADLGGGLEAYSGFAEPVLFGRELRVRTGEFVVAGNDFLISRLSLREERLMVLFHPLTSLLCFCQGGDVFNSLNDIFHLPRSGDD